ncbi:MAG: DMT family transporter [Pseudomonadota bacterium]
MTASNWGLLVLTAALFGSSFSVLNIAVDEVSPLQLATARAIIAAAILTPFMVLSGRQMPKDLTNWMALTVLGVLLAVIPYFAIAWGQTRITASLAGILFATIPFFTAILAPMVSSEPAISGKQSLGLILAFAGVILAIGPGALLHLGAELQGALVTLMAAISYALGNLYARAKISLDPVILSVGQLLTGSIMLVALSSVLGGSFPHDVTTSALLAVFAAGSIATAFPVLLMFILVKRVGATRTSLLAFFIPAASMLIGVILLGERLSLLDVLGFALISGGALWFARSAPQPGPVINTMTQKKE